jgi:hypothetical protein
MIPFAEKQDFSKRIKGKDVNDFDTIEILSEGQWIEDKFQDKQTGTTKINNGFWMQCKYKGQEREVKLTRESFENLEKSWGQDTKEWIGKTAIIVVKSYEKGKGILLKPTPKKIDGKEVVWD